MIGYEREQQQRELLGLLREAKSGAVCAEGTVHLYNVPARLVAITTTAAEYLFETAGDEHARVTRFGEEPLADGCHGPFLPDMKFVRKEGVLPACVTVDAQTVIQGIARLGTTFDEESFVRTEQVVSVSFV